MRSKNVTVREAVSVVGKADLNSCSSSVKIEFFADELFSCPEAVTVLEPEIISVDA
jgi:hypothetical protein